MPNSNPQIGETWTGPTGAEGVVIATNDQAVRLVSRTGRHLHLPIRSMVLDWTFKAPPPESHLCACGSVAYFRHDVGGNTTWVCSDHIPLGSLLLLPQDDATTPRQGHECPACRQATVSSQGFIPLRTTVEVFCCTSCRTRWCFLQGTGGVSDGINFGTDLLGVLEYFDGVNLQIRMGGLARDRYHRAVGTRIDHLQGVPIVTDSSYGELTVMVRSVGSEQATVMGPPRPQTPSLQSLQTLSRPISSNALEVEIPVIRTDLPPKAPPARDLPTHFKEDSSWVNYKTQALCKVQNSSETEVFCSEFRDSLPPELFSRMMRETSQEEVFCQNVNTMEVVYRLVEAGRLLNLDGTLHSTRYTSRLHKELPYPSIGTFWFLRDQVFSVLALRQTGDSLEDVTVCLRAQLEEPVQVSLAKLYRDYTYLYWEPSLTIETNENEVFIMQAQTLWLDTTIKKDVLLLGVCTMEPFFVMYRYVDQTQVLCKPLDPFLDQFDFQEPTPPCALGEEWIRDGDLYRVAQIDTNRARITLMRGELSQSVSFSGLTKYYQKMERRTWLEFLDEDDP